MKTLSSRTDRCSTSGGESSGPDLETPVESASLLRRGILVLGHGVLLGHDVLGCGAALVIRGFTGAGRGLAVAVRGVVIAGRGIAVAGQGVSVLGRGAGRLARFAGSRIRRWRIPERSGRVILAVAASSALMSVRVWLLCRVLFHSRAPRAPRRRRMSRTSRATGAHVARASGRSHLTAVADPPVSRAGSSRPARRSRPPVRLTARGGILAMFTTCFAGLLLADWANWAELADAVFFMASSLTAYYTRPGSLLPVAVSPPLLFFVAMTAEKFLVAAGTLAAFEGTLVMLASAATWLFAGTALTLAIALLRGLPREIRALVLELRG